MTSTGELAQDLPVRSRLKCWGDFALVDSTGTDLKPRGRKTRALFAYLAMHPGKPISRERLAGLLWGDRAEEQARASLRQALVELKPLANGAVKALEIERDHIAIRIGSVATDVDEISAAAGRSDYSAMLAVLPEPGERLFGNLDGLDEGFDEWLLIERTRQRDALTTLIAECSATAFAQGRARDAQLLHARVREFDPTTVAPGLATPAVHADVQMSPTAALNEPVRIGFLSRRMAALAVLLLAFVLIAVGSWQQVGPGPKPSATIAVLPFKSLPSGTDDFFAEGLSEEINAQLARVPGLRVAGRTSAWQFKDRTVGLDEVGRKLGVSYVLEGSVRAVGGRVRVNVALARASDGLQLWAETFDGTLDDVLTIQHRIGTSVTEALGRRLAAVEAPTGSMATSGAVYSLYLSARGAIRERNPLAMAAAKAKLERAVALDPNFAPAWAGLAQTTQFESDGPGIDAERERANAIMQARRALDLAPDLAHAHGVLGMVLGFEDPISQRHVKRAAALDPNDAEFQFWLGHVYANEADYSRMMAAYRRAFEIDPLWHYAQQYAIRSSWEMGEDQQAVRYVRRVERDGSRHQAHLARAMLAQAQGDFSTQASELAMAVETTGNAGRKTGAAYERAHVFFSLGFFDLARTEWSKVWEGSGRLSLQPERIAPYEGYFALRRGNMPDRTELRGRSGSAFAKDSAYALIAAKLLINADRWGDLLALYDSTEGFLGIRRGRTPTNLSNDVLSGPVVAAALRAAGREAEAARLLASIDGLLQAALVRNGSRVPATFLAEAAPVWALQGKHEAALSAIERAAALGWVYVVPDNGDSSLADIADEPAFRSLRGHPRFERLRSRLRAHLNRERRELVRQVAH